MTLEDGQRVATIVGVLVAIAVYITNSIAQRWQRRLDNATRIIAASQRLAQTKYMQDHWQAMDLKKFNRDTSDAEAERDFLDLLGEIEHIAYLYSLKAIPTDMNVYLFGWFALQLQPEIKKERDEVYWELAVGYLEMTKKAAEAFYKLPAEERRKRYRAVFAD